MMKKNNRSLVNHVLINNFSIIITALIVVFLSLFISLCTFYRSDRINEAKIQLSETVSAMRFAVEERIQQSDFIIRDSAIINGLNADYEDNYELISFTSDFGMFISSLDETESSGAHFFTLYTENPSLVNSGYIVKADSFGKFDEIRSNAIGTKQFFCWDTAVYTIDNTDERYLSLYRYVPSDYDFIIEMKIFINDSIPRDNRYMIDVVRYTGEGNDSLTFATELSGGFAVRAQVKASLLTKQYMIYFVMLLAVALAFLFVTYSLASRSVNRTMSDILELIDSIESGDLEKNGYSKADQWKEVNIIKSKISELTHRLSEISSKEYEQELLRRKLEIEVLNSKINPHLLYNSLSAIKLVAFKEKSLKVNDMADVLIEYYRLVLNKGEDTISVVRELEYLEKYIEIHEISKKINYEVEYDVCEEAFDIELPHMLLQPVIENAILHGLNTSTNAQIKISVRTEGDYLRIDISDNGVGIEPDKLSRLNTREGMGYGLRSVIQRADFYYDGDFEFGISSAIGEGTTVSLSIPKKIRSTI